MFTREISALLILLPTAALAGEGVAPASPGPAAPRTRTPHGPASPASLLAARPAVSMPLPPLPDGVQELKFADFFKLPVGPRGLEFSEQVAALDRRRVRILGYMVREQVDADEDDAHKDSGTPEVVHGRLMLTATRQIVNTAHYGLCEDLPPQTLFVTVPDHAGKPVPYTNGLLLLTGTLSVGARTEADGRTSIVRLALDPQPVIETAHATTPATLSVPTTASRPAETGKPENQNNP